MTDKPRKEVFRLRRLPIRISISKTTLPMFLDSEIMNLSKGGVFIRSDLSLPTGSEIDFQFTLPHTGKVVNAIGIVVWTRRPGDNPPTFPDHPAGMGVQFKKAEITDVDALLDEIEELIEKH